MKRCVIIGNSEIKEYNRIKTYLKDDDYFVYCDGGLKHIDGIGHKPDLIVGDFDSHENPHLEVETVVLPCEKDDTDTCHALKICIERGYTDFLFVGCIGRRLDHTLGNVFLLVMLKEKGLKGIMLDDYSEIGIVDSDGVYVEDEFPYFSLIALSDRAEGVTIEDAKYPLKDAVFNSFYQFGVSNEVIKGKRSKVTVKSGNVLIIKDFEG